MAKRRNRGSSPKKTVSSKKQENPAPVSNPSPEISADDSGNDGFLTRVARGIGNLWRGRRLSGDVYHGTTTTVAPPPPPPPPPPPLPATTTKATIASSSTTKANTTTKPYVSTSSTQSNTRVSSTQQNTQDSTTQGNTQGPTSSTQIILDSTLKTAGNAGNDSYVPEQTSTPRPGTGSYEDSSQSAGNDVTENTEEPTTSYFRDSSQSAAARNTTDTTTPQYGYETPNTMFTTTRPLGIGGPLNGTNTGNGANGGNILLATLLPGGTLILIAYIVAVLYSKFHKNNEVDVEAAPNAAQHEAELPTIEEVNEDEAETTPAVAWNSADYAVTDNPNQGRDSAQDAWDPAGYAVARGPDNLYEIPFDNQESPKSSHSVDSGKGDSLGDNEVMPSSVTVVSTEGWNGATYSVVDDFEHHKPWDDSTYYSFTMHAIAAGFGVSADGRLVQQVQNPVYDNPIAETNFGFGPGSNA